MYKSFFYDWYRNKSQFEQEYKQFCEVYKNRNGKMLKVSELDAHEVDLHKRGATIEQLVWRRLKISNSSDEQFKQEFPANDIEAFITTNNTIFDSKEILDRLVYAKQPLRELSSLPANLSLYRKNLEIYEMPTEGKKYYFGVDSAEGIGQDNSVICVVDEDMQQVAEFSDNKIAPHIFADVVHELAKYYNNAYVTVESASSGHTILSKLFYDYKYTNLHRHKSYDKRGRSKRKLGFDMNSVSRPLAISDLREYFETNKIWINSKELLNELKVFTLDSKGKIQAQRNFHDDRVIALALAIQGMKAGIRYIVK